MRRPLIGGEDFEASIGQGKQAQGRVDGEFFFGKGLKTKEEKEYLKEN
jgi:hypothetical protein